MRDEKKDVTAVVMGLSEIGLSVARALGRQRVPVIGTHQGHRPPASYSRFLSYVREPQTNSVSDRLKFFINLAQRMRSRPVLLPTFDKDVMFMSKNRELLEGHYHFFLADHALLKSITSKTDFISFAERLEITLPPSCRLSSESDIGKIPETFFPCVVKPERQTLWLGQKSSTIGIRGLKAIPAANRFELVSLYDRLKAVDPRLIAQKMIVGPDENHFDYHALVDSEDQIVGEFVGRKLRLTPPHFGMGCYVESAKSEEIVTEGRKILRKLNYRGMANVNFKKDQNDGRIYFLELNPRYSLWNGLDVACGMNFPYYHYQLCLGEKITPENNYSTGKKWVNLSKDIKGLKTLLNDGSWNGLQWLKSVIRADVGAIYAADDPLPSIARLFIFFKRRLPSIFSGDAA